MKKTGLALAVILLASLLSCGTAPSPRQAAAPAAQTGALFTGDGGAGTRITVLLLDAEGLPAGREYLPTLVQGVLLDDFSRFSAMSVLDRMSLEMALREAESGIYQIGADFGRLGEIVPMNYVLTGSITRTGAGYALRVQVVGTGRETMGITRAIFFGTLSSAEMNNFTGIRRASADLLTQMGIALTPAAYQHLVAVENQDIAAAEAAVALGLYHERRNDFETAILKFTEAIRLDPNNVEAHFWRGWLLLDDLDASDEVFARGMADLTQAIRLDPGHEFALYIRGNMHLEMGDFALAIADFTQIIRINGDRVLQAYVARADAYLEMGDFTLAIADLTQIIRLDPNSVWAYFFRGVAYFYRGDFDLAVADFEAVLRINPNNADARHNLAIARQRAGR